MFKGKKIVVIACMLLVFSLTLISCGKKEENNQAKKDSYPEKTIKVVSWMPKQVSVNQIWKQILNVMEQKSGWKFEYTNAPAKMGSAALKQVWEAPHDGYTVLAQTEDTLGLGVRGLVDQTSKDWGYFQAFQNKSAIMVSKKSPYKNIEAIINAAKSNPKTVKIGYVGIGSVHNLHVKALEIVTGAKFAEKGFKNSPHIEQKTFKALKSGEIDALILPINLPRKAMRQGELRPLAIFDMGSMDFGGKVGEVPPITDSYPEYKKVFPLDVTIGFAMPKDVSQERKKAFGKVFEQAVNSPQIEDLIAGFNGVKLNIWGESAEDYMLKFESNFTWLLKDAGLAKKSPEELGIPKPEYK